VYMCKYTRLCLQHTAAHTANVWRNLPIPVPICSLRLCNAHCNTAHCNTHCNTLQQRRYLPTCRARTNANARTHARTHARARTHKTHLCVYAPFKKKLTKDIHTCTCTHTQYALVCVCTFQKETYKRHSFTKEKRHIKDKKEIFIGIHPQLSRRNLQKTSTYKQKRDSTRETYVHAPAPFT